MTIKYHKLLKINDDMLRKMMAKMMKMMHHNHIKMIDDDNISWILEDKWWDVEKKMPMMHQKPMLSDKMM